MKSQGYWTAEREDALRGMLERGLSVTQAANELARAFGPGVTRNSVIGKASRKGWIIGAVPKKVASLPPAARRPPPAAPAFVAPRPPRPSPAPAHAPLTRGGWPKPPNEHSVTIIGLTSTTCRTPLWADDCTDVHERFYCGRPVDREGSSWCAGCRMVLTAPAAKPANARAA